MKNIKLIGSAVVIAFLIFMLFAIFATSSSANTGADYKILQDQETILQAQKNAVGAHETLFEIMKAQEALNKAKEQAERETTAYSNTANTARKNICNLSQDHCIKEYLDPMGTGVNIDHFLQ